MSSSLDGIRQILKQFSFVGLWKVYSNDYLLQPCRLCSFSTLLLYGENEYDYSDRIKPSFIITYM